MASDIALHYFGGRGIGEPVRLLLTVGGIEFHDYRYTVEEFADKSDLKEKLPFGQVPALEVDGEFLAQADSIARLAARLAGLYPSDPVDAAKSDMIVAAQADIQSAIAKMSFDGVPGAPGTTMVPEDEKRARVEVWFESTLPVVLQRLEKLANDGFMVGSTMSWADICVFNRLNHLQDIDAGILSDAYPKLRSVFDNVGAVPSIQAWIAAHTEDYPRYQRGD